MRYIYAKINKGTLKFIRTQRGISFDYISRMTKFSQGKVEQWENELDNKLPTINQAKELAKCYHVPFAGFYMEQQDINVQHIPRVRNMRTFNNAIADDSAVNLAIIDLLNDRDFYIESKELLKEKVRVFSLRISGNSVYEWSEIIRKYLRFDIKEQYALPSSRKLYLLIRKRVEELGIFVQCFRGVDPEVMRGIAIYDNRLPIIGINDNDRYPAKIFTILHELVHIIKRKSSMCNEIYNAFAVDKEEIFCNAIAGEILIPSNILNNDYGKWGDSDFDIEAVDNIAAHFSVSSEVTARRLMDCKICTQSWYRIISEKLTDRFIKSKEESKKLRQLTGKGIPRNMPREAIDRTSTDLSRILIKGYTENIFDKFDLAAHVGIKERHIDSFIKEVSKW